MAMSKPTESRCRDGSSTTCRMISGIIRDVGMGLLVWSLYNISCLHTGLLGRAILSPPPKIM